MIPSQNICRRVILPFTKCLSKRAMDVFFKCYKEIDISKTKLASLLSVRDLSKTVLPQKQIKYQDTIRP